MQSSLVKTAFLCNISQKWKQVVPEVLGNIKRIFTEEEALFFVDRKNPVSSEEHLKKILESGFERIVVVGGDGTLNRTVNFLQRNQFLDQVTLGIIPFGTCNDFAKTIGLPKGDAFFALESLEKNKIKRVKVAQVNRHYFLNNSGFGRSNPGKRRKGPIADINQMKPIRTKIIWENGLLQDEFFMMICANAPYFSDGLHFSKESNPYDERLEFFFVRKMSKVRLLAKLFFGKRGRPLEKSPIDESILRIDTTKITVQTNAPIWVMTDGELVPELSAIREAVFQIAGTCNFVVPEI
ncbi:MAG: hypothetical protein A3I11_05310 [Elusimicrobia bacterium RIFCSPLOWO2_02_FULL_39_32]|nr:MAG: hypothetical protein A3B80_00295 [Elusimicrobia bacterium RIFCSPHIGHO2_02_FULL_39_36]OGR91166.1 MAG: hypothetical protein A3I11_05310 [Elusimicrobia bacterium RIFCSPLOWO2_02_FULL_39_32]OGS00134.1 MAG: hypothetical protein A3G85_08275 [Elusimicrobia bacterium RIFCSPLOWO2_12_FULL_39_28]